MYKAIYVSTGAYDAVLLENGTFLMVEQDTWAHFLEAEKNGDDFSDWNGLSLDLDDDMDYDGEDWLWLIAENMGDIVAYYDEYGKLVVHNSRLFNEIKDLWER